MHILQIIPSFWLKQNNVWWTGTSQLIDPPLTSVKSLTTVNKKPITIQINGYNHLSAQTCLHVIDPHQIHPSSPIQSLKSTATILSTPAHQSPSFIINSIPVNKKPITIQINGYNHLSAQTSLHVIDPHQIHPSSSIQSLKSTARILSTPAQQSPSFIINTIPNSHILITSTNKQTNQYTHFFFISTFSIPMAKHFALYQISVATSGRPDTFKNFQKWN